MLAVVARDVRRNDQIRGIPERGFGRQWLRLRHVEHRAGQFALGKLVAQGNVVRHRRARNVDHSAGRLEKVEARAVEQAPRLGRQWNGQHDEIGLREHLVERGRAVNLVRMRHPLACATYPDDTEPELLSRAYRRLSKVAQPHDQRGFPRHAARKKLPPPAIALLGDDLGHAGVQQRIGHAHELLGLYAMCPAVIRECGARREPVERQNTIDPGRGGVHPPEARRALRQIFSSLGHANHDVGRLQRIAQGVAIRANGRVQAPRQAAVPVASRMPEFGRNAEELRIVARVFYVNANSSRGHGARA